MNYVRMLIISLLIHSYSSIQAEPIYASWMHRGKMNIFLYGDDVNVTHRDTYDDFIAALKQLAAQDKKVLLLLEDGRSLSWADKIRQELPKKVSIKNMGEEAGVQLCYAFEKFGTGRQLISNATVKDLFCIPAQRALALATSCGDQTAPIAGILHALAGLASSRATLLIDMLEIAGGAGEKVDDVLLLDAMTSEHSSGFEPWLACFAQSKHAHLLGFEAEVAYALKEICGVENNYDFVIVLAQHEKVAMLRYYSEMLKFKVQRFSGTKEWRMKEKSYSIEYHKLECCPSSESCLRNYLVSLSHLHQTKYLCHMGVVGAHLSVTSSTLYPYFFSRLGQQLMWKDLTISARADFSRNIVLDLGMVVMNENAPFQYDQAFSPASYQWMCE